MATAEKTTNDIILHNYLAGTAVDVDEVKDDFDALANACCPVGAIMSFFGASDPHSPASVEHGWILCDDRTIGSSDSGSTSSSHLAGDSLVDLYYALWDNDEIKDLDFYTSAGVADSRGDSALADWTANKRIALPNVTTLYGNPIIRF